MKHLPLFKHSVIVSATGYVISVCCLPLDTVVFLPAGAPRGGCPVHCRGGAKVSLIHQDCCGREQTLLPFRCGKRLMVHRAFPCAYRDDVPRRAGHSTTLYPSYGRRFVTSIRRIFVMQWSLLTHCKGMGDFKARYQVAINGRIPRAASPRSWTSVKRIFSLETRDLILPLQVRIAVYMPSRVCFSHLV